ncbi:MAG: VCBS repeat-containing protein, partial [Chlorobiales bacterium]|nr:VCBS repeat-containing protein [Chlorobiales bacterium]
MGFVPQVVDINADGYQDIISGSYAGDGATGMGQLRSQDGSVMSEIFVFYGEADGTYKARQRLAVSYMHSTPIPVDYDGDGDFDLISSAFATKKAKPIVLLENTGTAEKPKFDAPKGLVDDLELGTAAYASAVAYDWDKDGLLDLIASGYGNGSIYFHKNVGSKEEPKFDKAEVLKEGLKAGKKPDENIPWGSSLFLHIVDWDGDGVNDIMAGDSWMETQIVQGLSEEEQKEIAEAKARFDAFQAKVMKIYQEKDYNKMEIEERQA